MGNGLRIVSLSMKTISAYDEDVEGFTAATRCAAYPPGREGGPSELGLAERNTPGKEVIR